MGSDVAAVLLANVGLPFNSALFHGTDCFAEQYLIRYRPRLPYRFFPHFVLSAFAAIWERFLGASFSAPGSAAFESTETAQSNGVRFLDYRFSLLLGRIVHCGFADGFEKDLMGELVGVTRTLGRHDTSSMGTLKHPSSRDFKLTRYPRFSPRSAILRLRICR